MAVGKPMKRSSSAPSLTGGDWEIEETDEQAKEVTESKWYYNQIQTGKVESNKLGMHSVQKERALPALMDDKESTCSSHGRNTPEHSRTGLNSKAVPFVPFNMYQQPESPMTVTDYATVHTSQPSTPVQSPISPATFPYPSPQQQPLPLPQTAYPSAHPSYYEDAIPDSPSVQPIQYEPPIQVPISVPQVLPIPTAPLNNRKRSSRTRSKLMEEYRATASTCNWELKQLQGYVVEFTTDQEGSRLIQRKLEKSSPEDLMLVFKEVIPVALQLMQDVFGNYVIQKLLEHGTPGMRKELVDCLRGNTLMLTLQTYGCRIVQKALEVMTDSERADIVREVDGHVPRCVQDQNGNHVIQKCIEVMSDKVGFIVKAFVGRVAAFATHAYGCRCVQRILEYCKNHKEIVPILEEILQSVQSLVTDQYGNYVVQHVIINGHPQYQYAITSKLRGYYTVLSTHKFASNVVEKMFEYASPAVRISLLEELTMHQREDGVSGLVGAVMDQYGNYVMQKIFDLCDEKQKALVVEHLKPNVHYLRRAPFGKHFVTRLEKQGCLSTGPAPAPSSPIITKMQSPQTVAMNPRHHRVEYPHQVQTTVSNVMNSQQACSFVKKQNMSWGAETRDGC
eukprot:TRINITY_DN304_c1_g3_i1.p1 TRINITY_DN304_c1_g3~~TRINITY_DN304_c1_g3_i1.p1  ORF type:complete len:620 (+),score=179.41 TRINITY_DN304_c1_g3_i1:139-1998(+)